MTTPLSTNGLSRLLRLIGLVAVVLSSLSVPLWHHPWLAAGAVLSWAGWAVWALAPALTPVTVRLCVFALAIGGGLTGVRVPGSAISALVAPASALAMVGETLWFGLGVSALTVVCLGISILTTPGNVTGVVGLLIGLVVVGLIGWSRRQARTTSEQNRILVEQSRVIRDERDRAAAMAERGRLARDIHDVLAHTLGGLVLQLDAADALLEAGDVQRAAERVKASHKLAVSGLDDARRVVNALRAERFDLSGELERLLQDHRAVGGQVRLHADVELRGVDEQVAVALTRAVQEVLTNARKHAPDQPVALTIRDADAGFLEIEATNPIASHWVSLGSTGAGAGLLGMTERIAAVGGSVEADRVAAGAGDAARTDAEDGLSAKEGRWWRVRIRVPRR
ncbi:sensor histidine kinase [Nocardia alni]|uniref:sensor histidine kinase n=1 Tax=Nocardia alni TaxID=2815723 RepID=UPI001C213350|nr:histidine kinase [Nocardia alni]